MDNKCLISICIPTYNRASYLDHAIKSIIENCDDLDIELVVSNNASTDNTTEIVSKYQLEYPFIKYYINDENVGFDNNILLCVQRASGKTTDAVKEAIEFIKNNNYPTVAVINWELVDLNGVITRKHVVNIDKDVYTNDPSIYLRTVSNKLAFISSIIIKKECIAIDKTIEGLIESGYIQVGILFNAIKASPSIAIMAKVLITQTAQERIGENIGNYIYGIHAILWSYQRDGLFSYLAVYKVTNKIMINFIFHQSRNLELRFYLHSMIKEFGWSFLIRAYYRYPLFWLLCLPLILVNDRLAIFLTDNVIDKIRNKVVFLKKWC